MAIFEETKEFLLIFYSISEIYAFNFEHFEEKDEPHSFLSEIIDGEERGYVSVYRATFQYSLWQSTC